MNHFVRHLESKYDASTKPFEEFATEIAEYAFFDCDHSDIGKLNELARAIIDGKFANYKRRGVSIVDSFQSCDRTFRGLMSTLRFCPEFDVKEYRWFVKYVDKLW
jgi:hypothetical protein